MPLTDQQIRELQIAQQRVAQGTASDADRRNIQYATERYAPTDPRIRDLSVAPPLQPQGTGQVRDINTGLTVNQAQTPAPTPSVPSSFAQSGSIDNSKYTSALTTLLQQYQQTAANALTPYRQQQFNAESEQARRLASTSPDLIGASPSVQAEARNASVDALSPTITGAQRSKAAVIDQLNAINTTIGQAQTLAGFLQDQDNQKRTEALELLFKFPGAVQALDEKSLKEFSKLTKIPVESIMAIPDQAKQSNQEIVNDFIIKYPDAGILPTDNVETASQKIKNSAIFKRETYIAPSGSGSTKEKLPTNLYEAVNIVAEQLNQAKSVPGGFTGITYDTAVSGLMKDWGVPEERRGDVESQLNQALQRLQFGGGDNDNIASDFVSPNKLLQASEVYENVSFLDKPAGQVNIPQEILKSTKKSELKFRL